MKAIRFMIAIFFITSIATAQKTISQIEEYKNSSTISAAGSSFQNDEISINWTLGDTLYILSEDNISEVSPEIIDLNFIVRAYPNPTKDKLIISQEDENVELLNVIIYDLNGKKLLQKSMNLSKTEISLKYLPSALYEIKILNSKNQFLKSFKIIKN